MLAVGCSLRFVLQNLIFVPLRSKIKLKKEVKFRSSCHSIIYRLLHTLSDSTFHYFKATIRDGDSTTQWTHQIFKSIL